MTGIEPLGDSIINEVAALSHWWSYLITAILGSLITIIPTLFIEYRKEKKKRELDSILVLKENCKEFIRLYEQSAHAILLYVNQLTNYSDVEINLTSCYKMSSMLSLDSNRLFGILSKIMLQSLIDSIDSKSSPYNDDYVILGSKFTASYNEFFLYYIPKIPKKMIIDTKSEEFIKKFMPYTTSNKLDELLNKIDEVPL